MIRAIDNIATQSPVTRSTATGYRYGRSWYQSSSHHSTGAKESASSHATDAVKVTISQAAQLAAGQTNSSLTVAEDDSDQPVLRRMGNSAGLTLKKQP
ncbi:MAG: hypothetical protein HQL58_06190 [Magnetococcales bacterium]|nr:hypothetical protein [Magnetococcales bacterium]